MADSKRKSKSANDTRSIMTELMMPNMANTLGNVFGGVILSLIDRVAAVAAIRHAAGPCVTVSVDRVEFREPIHVGELVTATADIHYVGRTSIDVGVRVDAENIVTGVKRHTNSCYLTFVAIDKRGRPIPVPRVQPSNTAERRWYEHAKLRRHHRDEERKAKETD